MRNFKKKKKYIYIYIYIEKLEIKNDNVATDMAQRECSKIKCYTLVFSILCNKITLYCYILMYNVVG